ncbi:MAG: mono/diheme cytochrome c family protein [Myxococcota bacterium]
MLLHCRVVTSLISSLLVLALGVLSVACDSAGDSDGTPASPPYLGDASARRALLEAALWRPELPYSRELLDSYGFGDRGWDLLPILGTESRPFTVTDAAHLASGGQLDSKGATSLGDRRPTTQQQWRRLGESVFTLLPMREDGYVTWLASNPQAWPELGVAPRADGTVRGLVVYPRLGGNGAAVGVTCAMCHGGDNVLGRGDRHIDVGAIRVSHAEALGRTPEPILRNWGPGRADVTDDGVSSVTAIPDLWGLDEAQYLNASGAIAAASPGAMAVRFETQYIKGHRMRARPSRTTMWALTQFLISLKPPADDPRFAGVESQPALANAGQAAFEANCARCHEPNRAFSGGLVSAASLAVEQSVATTPERGTGFYKVPSLRHVRANAPYLHDGSAPSLAALLASGHPRGDVLPATARSALIAYLETL